MRGQIAVGLRVRSVLPGRLSAFQLRAVSPLIKNAMNQKGVKEPVLRIWHTRITLIVVKTLTVRLPIAIVNDIEVESRRRQISKSDVVRERLMARRPTPRRTAALDAIADLVGSVRGLPPDLSARRKHYLKATRYGRKRPR